MARGALLFRGQPVELDSAYSHPVAAHSIFFPFVSFGGLLPNRQHVVATSFTVDVFLAQFFEYNCMMSRHYYNEPVLHVIPPRWVALGRVRSSSVSQRRRQDEGHVTRHTQGTFPGSPLCEWEGLNRSP